MADYGYFENPKAKTFTPEVKTPPGQRVMELIEENARLKQELEEAKAVTNLRSMADELENGPIVHREGERTRTLTQFTVRVRNYLFTVNRQSVYGKEDTWQVACQGVFKDFGFHTRNPSLIDSECEAAADFFDALKDLGEQEAKLKAEFNESRNKAEIAWEGLIW